jgi:hypothetical protein
MSDAGAPGPKKWRTKEPQGRVRSLVFMMKAPGRGTGEEDA